MAFIKFSMPPKLMTRIRLDKSSMQPMTTPMMFKVSPMIVFLGRLLLAPFDSKAKIRPREPKISEVPKQLVMMETMPKAREANAIEAEPCSKELGVWF